MLQIIRFYYYVLDFPTNVTLLWEPACYTVRLSGLIWPHSSFASCPTKDLKAIPHKSRMEGQLAGKNEGAEARFPTISLSVYVAMCFSVFKIAHLISDFRIKFLYAFYHLCIGSTKMAITLGSYSSDMGWNSDSQTVYPEAFRAPAGEFLKCGHNPLISHALSSSL